MCQSSCFRSSHYLKKTVSHGQKLMYLIVVSKKPSFTSLHTPKHWYGAINPVPGSTVVPLNEIPIGGDRPFRAHVQLPVHVFNSDTLL